MATAGWEGEVIIGGDFLVLRGAVLVGGDLFDDQEGVGRVGEARREEFDPEWLVFFGIEGMVNRSFGKSEGDVLWVGLSGQEGIGGMRNSFSGSEESVGMFATAGEGEVVDFEEVSAGGGGFESERGIAVEWGLVIGAGDFGSIGRDQDEGGVETRVDGLSLAVKVDGLILGEGELVVIDGGVIDVAIDDGVEREVFRGFGRVVGAVVFFGKVTDDESAGSGEAEAGLGGDLVDAGREIGGGDDAVAERIGFGGDVIGRGKSDGFGGESGVGETEGGGFFKFGSADGDFGGGARLDTLGKDGFQIGVWELRVQDGRTRDRER